jgi:hypothetical protein
MSNLKQLLQSINNQDNTSDERIIDGLYQCTLTQLLDYYEDSSCMNAINIWIKGRFLIIFMKATIDEFDRASIYFKEYVDNFMDLEEGWQYIFDKYTIDDLSKLYNENGKYQKYIKLYFDKYYFKIFKNSGIHPSQFIRSLTYHYDFIMNVKLPTSSNDMATNYEFYYNKSNNLVNANNSN